MTKRTRAVAQTTERLGKLRAPPTYRPGPFPWKALLAGGALVGLLAVLTAPRSER